MASGQEFEHGEGQGRLVCIDPTKTGDISSELALDKAGKPLPHRRMQAVIPKEGDKSVPNPNTGLVWEYTSFDHDGNRKLDFEEVLHRTVSSVAIKADLLIAVDTSGLVLCCDALTGKWHWAYDMLASIPSNSPLIVDDWVYVADEDGDVSVFRLSADPKVALTKESEPIAEINVGPSIYAAPVFANGVLYLATRSMLFAVADTKSAEEEARADDSRLLEGHWPQWRGPNRDNVSQETGLLQQWPDEGPPLAWQAEGIGTGISCLAVAGGRIFTLGYRGESEYAIALDERTGELQWATRIGPSIFETRLMRWLAQRTPTVDEDRVYVVTYKGELVCLKTTTGEQLWRKNYQDDFGTNWNTWGTADYPLVDGDKLICSPQGKEATFAALDKRTGKVLWTSLIPDAGRRSYAAIVSSDAAGVRQYITFLGNSIVGVAADDGKLLWRYKTVANGTANSHTPIVVGDHVYCSSGYGTGIALLQLVADQGGVAAKEVYFQRQSLDTFLDPTILVDDRALTIQSGSVLLRFDWKTGDVVWKDRLDVTGRMSPTFADGRLYLFSAAGEALLIEDAADGPQERGRLTLPDFERAVGATNPVVAGGRLYLRDDDRLYCYDLRKDAQREEGVKPPTIKIHIPPEIKDEGDAKPSTTRTPKPIFVPTPHDVVEKMLVMASVKKEDTVVDLGSGDGRIVIAAAKSYGAKAIGYEIDEELVALSREKLKQAEVQQLAGVRQEDMYKADLSGVSVAAVYLYPVVLEKLKPQFAKMKPGSRIVSHYFEVPGVRPDRVIQVVSKDSGNVHQVLLYTTPLVEQDKADNDQQPGSKDQ